MDSWPLWSQDGFIYFVSDREGKGQTNIWRVAESGGDAEQVTRFTSGDVRFPAISGDGKTIVFEHDFGIWKLDLASRQVKPIPLEIAAETQETLTEFRTSTRPSTTTTSPPTASGSSCASTARSSRPRPTKAASSASSPRAPPATGTSLIRPTASRSPSSPTRAAARRSTSIAADGAGPAQKVTDLDALKSSLVWSPDSKSIAFTTSDRKLYTIGADGKNLKELASSTYGPIGSPAWSPDGKLIAYSKTDVSRSTDIYLIPSRRRRGEEDHVRLGRASPTPASRPTAPRSTSSAARATSAARRGPRRSSSACRSRSSTKDPDEPEQRAAMARPAEPGPEARAGWRPGGRSTPKTPEDRLGRAEAAHPAGHADGSVFNYIPGSDGKTLIFVGSEGGAGGGGPGGSAAGRRRHAVDLHDPGQRQADDPDRHRHAQARRPSEDDDRPRGFRGGFRRRDLQPATHQGRPHALLPGRRVGLQHAGRRRRRRRWRRWRRRWPAGRRRRPAARPGGSAAAAGAGGGGGGAKRRISFNVTVRIDKPQEWDEMFDDAWRCMKYRFYDPKLHGTDWDAMRAKYKPLVAYVADRHELMNVINEMIGELNASHTGASAGRDRGAAGEAAARHDPPPRPRPRARRRPAAATRSPTSTKTGRPTRTGSRSRRGTT